MNRTWLGSITAIILVLVSVAVMWMRTSTLGDEIDGPQGASSWRIRMVAIGQGKGKNPQLSIALPPDFRRQHIVDERIPTGEPLPTKQGREERRIIWVPAQAAKPSQANVSYRAVLGMRRPTPAMVQRTAALDAKPTAGEYIKPSPLIQSEDVTIATVAAKQFQPDEPTLERIRGMYHFVANLAEQPTQTNQSALACLRRKAGNAGAKSRLLVASCRSQGIPARLVSGLRLLGDQEQSLHYWVEVWADNYWLPLCPTYQHFGSADIPDYYLVLALDDRGVIQAQDMTFSLGFATHLLREDYFAEDQPTAMKQLWRALSLYNLGPAEQNLVRFLLLLPLAALIVCMFRIVVGVATFGTFGPALLGMAFLDLRSILWGLGTFVLIILAGWLLRRILDNYRLLMVPRTAALLTLIIIMLTVLALIAGSFGIAVTRYISLFPLIILTHMVERFWMVEAEDGASASFKTLAGTLVVTVAVSLVLSPTFVADTMFRYPELLGIVLAAALLLGRYTGYRLSELYRFRDFVQETPTGA